MSYQVRTETRPCRSGWDGTFYILEDGTTGGRAVIWPGLGFNCVSWTTPFQGQPVDWLWSTPELLTDPRPTRSGVPILFPFPNRIRGGRFEWRGQTFQLPINDAQKRNAIHGFAAQRPWRIIGHGADATGAWLHGQFQGCRDAPDCRSLWPADYQLDAIYRLTGTTLQLELTITNPDSQDLPCGIGLHPYFRFAADTAAVRTPPLQRWLLDNSLPTGDRVPLEGQHRLLTEGEPFGTHQFDDVYQANEKTVEVTMCDTSNRRNLQMSCDGGWRWLVIFTPPHREAICVEPYTCVTDPFNTVSPDGDTGLMVLKAGGTWRGTVRWTMM
jgi:aldose 1-epimerase